MISATDPRCVTPNRRRELDVVNDCLQDISPRKHLHLQNSHDAGVLVSGDVFDREGNVKTREFRARNVGFGLSYVLPVVIALLLGRGEKSLCIIEHPEAHLHPFGQTKLRELAARSALAGVQVILETHSDHLLDGIRIAVRKQQIEPDKVAIHYLERKNVRTMVQSTVLDSDGRVYFGRKDSSINLRRIYCNCSE